MTTKERRDKERDITLRERRNMSPLTLGLQAVIEHHHADNLEYKQAGAHVAFMLALGEFFPDALTEEAKDYLAVLLENQDAILDQPHALMATFTNTLHGRIMAINREREKKYREEQYQRQHGVYTAMNDSIGRR